MSSSIILTIKSARPEADNVLNLKHSTTSPREQAKTLENYFHALANGSELASFELQTAALAPVRSSGTLTVVYATIANGSTIVIGGTTLTCVTGTPSGFTEFKKQTNLATTIANLAAAINGNTTTNQLVSAAVTATGVVTVSALAAGPVGDQITLVGGTGITAGAATLAGGAGGAGSIPVTFSLGL